MKRSLFVLALAAVMLLAAPVGHAAIIHFIADLDGPSEDPPNASPGTGFATVDVDTLLHTMGIHAEFSGLTAPTTASHIHCCTAVPLTGTAGVATTTPFFVGFPIGVTSGIFDTVLDLTLISSFNPAFVAAHGGTAAGAEDFLTDGMIAETSYFNIHTSRFPGGEIRGFLLPAAVPEPGMLGLLALGLGAGLVSLRRKRA